MSTPAKNPTAKQKKFSLLCDLDWASKALAEPPPVWEPALHARAQYTYDQAARALAVLELRAHRARLARGARAIARWDGARAASKPATP